MPKFKARTTIAALGAMGAAVGALGGAVTGAVGGAIDHFTDGN